MAGPDCDTCESLGYRVCDVCLAPGPTERNSFGMDRCEDCR